LLLRTNQVEARIRVVNIWIKLKNLEKNDNTRITLILNLNTQLYIEDVRIPS